MEKTIEIPEGYEARIEGNKVILAPKESEDERIRKELLEVIRHCYEDGGYALCTDDYKKYSACLEKQKDEAQKQFNLGVQAGREEVLYEMEKEQQPAEWSEEEKDKVAQYLHDRDGGMLWSKATEITGDILDILRPQPHWKPSEEQINHLGYAYTQLKLQKCYAPHVYETLGSLYDDLKKLM